MDSSGALHILIIHKKTLSIVYFKKQEAVYSHQLVSETPNGYYTLHSFLKYFFVRIVTLLNWLFFSTNYKFHLLIIILNQILKHSLRL